ncbi:MAG: hypothetical protein QHH10_11120 [Peptococcaceae bacterium]|jgi:hypothetical protein|nr:hypothetical protein [Peptococcaceae bacterium]MDH7525850.1 hypothetical protein [Peptococcaceae bacterium]
MQPEIKDLLYELAGKAATSDEVRIVSPVIVAVEPKDEAEEGPNLEIAVSALSLIDLWVFLPLPSL